MLSIKSSLVKILVLFTALFALHTSAFAGDKQKVVYHIDEKSKIGLALVNMSFHIQGVKGPENIDIVVVVNAQAILGFKKDEITPDTVTKVDELIAQGVKFEACGNALNFFKLDLKDLTPGFRRLEEGGVTRIAQLQMDGYAYIKP